MNYENIIISLILLALPLLVLAWMVFGNIRKDRRRTTRINHAARSEMILGLGLSIEQIDRIVIQRNKSGYFVDYEDFVARTGCFSSREYKALKKYLDFTIDYAYTQINHAPRSEIMEGLGLTGGQAKQLVAQRDSSGYFADYNDFITQTGLPETQCAKFKECLDFTINYASTRINHAGREEMKAGLRLGNDQARKIVAERDARGDFNDYDDFVRRTGLPETQCAKFREYLDFTIKYASTRINYAGKDEMKAGLRLGNDQARKIVAERDARGDFLNYKDFIARTGFSEEECARFKKWLRFAATYTSEQINYAPWSQIKAGLRLTSDQARKIVAERDARGEFPDYADFVRRTGFSEEECGRFKRWLDFTVATKINHAAEAEIRAQLGLTADEAKTIVAARKAQGNFLDYNDFRKKTRLSGTDCRRFKKYLDFTIRPSEIQAPQPAMNDAAEINLDEILREAKTGATKRTDANTTKKANTNTTKRTGAGTAGAAQAGAPARLPPTKINDASEIEIQERLGVTVIQAKMIVAERKTQGDYLDYGDFVKRTGLSERVCSGFKDGLDFTVHHFPDRKQGRVLDIQ